MSEIEANTKGSRERFFSCRCGNSGDGVPHHYEASLAAEERNVFHPGAVVIDANENPLGPCDAARKAIVDMAPQGDGIPTG